jgi:hypothetical protein
VGAGAVVSGEENSGGHRRGSDGDVAKQPVLGARIHHAPSLTLIPLQHTKPTATISHPPNPDTPPTPKRISRLKLQRLLTLPLPKVSSSIPASSFSEAEAAPQPRRACVTEKLQPMTVVANGGRLHLNPSRMPNIPQRDSSHLQPMSARCRPVLVRLRSC